MESDCYLAGPDMSAPVYSREGRYAPVKIRGQRLELGEVENHVRECLPQARKVAADTIKLSSSEGDHELAAFVVFGKDRASKEPRLISVSDATVRDLIERLPSYMIPATFIALSQMPLNVSGKTDRRKLKEVGSSFSASPTRSTVQHHPWTQTDTSYSAGTACSEALGADSQHFHRQHLRLISDSSSRQRRGLTISR